MKKYFKLVSLCMAILMIAAFALAGCGSTPSTEPSDLPDTSGTPSESTSGSSDPVAEKVTLQWWQFWSVGDEENSIKSIAIDAYEAANPHVKIEATQLGWGDGFARIQTAIGAGVAPDCLELGSTWVGAFADVGALTDLTPYLTPEVKNKYINWNLGETLDGKIVAFPWAVGTRALAVNYDLVRQAGYDPANFPKDWNGLIDLAKAIKEKCGVDGFLICAGHPTGDYQTWGDFLYSVGGAYIETQVQDDGSTKLIGGVTSDAAKKALDFYDAIKPYSMVDTQANAALAFQANRLGMVIMDNGFTAGMITDGSAVNDWGYEIIPACPDTGKTLAFNGAEVLTIPMQSKNKDEAFKYLAYLADAATSTEICRQCSWSILPSISSLDTIPELANPAADDIAGQKVQRFIEIAKKGYTFAPPINKRIEDIGMRISTMIQEIYLNGVPRDEAVEACQKDIANLLGMM